MFLPPQDMPGYDVALNARRLPIEAKTVILPEMLWVWARIVWRDHVEQRVLGRAFQRYENYLLVYPMEGWQFSAHMWLPLEDLEPASEADSPYGNQW